MKNEIQCLLYSWGTVFCSGLQIRRWCCAHLRRSLGSFTLLIKQPTSIPLLCNKAGRDVAGSRNSTRSHLPSGGLLELVMMMLQLVSFLTGLSFLLLGGVTVCSHAQGLNPYLLCAGPLQAIQRSLSHVHPGIHAPLWL